MVMKTSEFTYLLQHPEKINSEQFKKLSKILERYPYFQSALSIRLKYLKREKLISKTNLSNAAVHITDRSVLFDFIEGQKNAYNSAADVMHPAYEIKTGADKYFSDTNTNKLKKQKSEKSGSSKKLRPPKKPLSDEKLSYLEWMHRYKHNKQRSRLKNLDVIEKFLINNPKITPVKNQHIKPAENIEKSVEERQTLMTETLANLYVKQEKYEKAIQAFKILSLKYPKKSGYFANRISELKQKIK